MRSTRRIIGAAACGLLLALLMPAVAGADGEIVAWGANARSQCDVPEPNADFVAVAAGSFHSLGLKSDGSIVAWGSNEDWDGNYCGQCDVPAPNADFVALAGGESHSLGLKSDGSIVAWGSNEDWEGNYTGQCDVPAPNTDFVALAAGGYHSLGLKSDGLIVAWGHNGGGQCNVPAPNTDFVALAAGSSHSLGLKSDGSMVAWGSNSIGQCDVPAPNTDFVALAGGGAHSLGLKADGSIVAWGWSEYAQCRVPAPNTDFVAVAAHAPYSLGLKSDGSILAWGAIDHGQGEVPAPNAHFVAIAAGIVHSLGIRPPGGACCHADGFCDVLTESDCTAAGGTYQGDDTDCDPNPCPQPGACCLVTGVCVETLEAECTGDWLGADTTCAGDCRWYRDADGDGYGDPDESYLGTEQPTGHVKNGDDCDDTDSSVHPDATETCNGIDDDCDDQVDEGDIGTWWYRDADADGYGNPHEKIKRCNQPSGYVENDLDSDDLDPDIQAGQASPGPPAWGCCPTAGTLMLTLGAIGLLAARSRVCSRRRRR